MSDWKQSAAKRRDTRATKTDGVTGLKKKKKDTKRWCKGKEGREHVIERRNKKIGNLVFYNIDVCINCSKIMKTIYDRWPWQQAKDA